MSKNIGIRKEDKYLMERRTPITPLHVNKLINSHDIAVTVQASEKRVFTDQEYLNAGAAVEDDLKDCELIFGVKEIPDSAFEQNKTYVFFSHVIKGQTYNMPMLKRMMELKCNLIDYECITGEQNKRLIFFGKYAGLAGMINALWSTGQRLKELGISDNPFLTIRQAQHYDTLDEAKHEIAEAGKMIAIKGLPKELRPFTIGLTGYGNVAAGAREIADLLPSVEITPRQLLNLASGKNLPENLIYKITFKEEHLVCKKTNNCGCGCSCNSDNGAADNNANDFFDLQHYYENPDSYQNDFEQYIPHLSVLMNCMYWDARYPRIVTKEYIRRLFKKAQPKLTVIGDITCDPNGSVEITHKGTTIEDPVFVYNPDTENALMGFKGHGVLVMAVDILPSELPRDASLFFADALYPFISDIAKADFNNEFDKLILPKAIKNALILHKGKLTPKFRYLAESL